MRKSKKSKQVCLQLCLFSESQMLEMTEPLPEIVPPIDPLPALFILPYLKGKPYRHERARLTLNRRKKAVVSPVGLSPGLVIKITLFDTASKSTLVT